MTSHTWDIITTAEENLFSSNFRNVKDFIWKRNIKYFEDKGIPSNMHGFEKIPNIYYFGVIIELTLLLEYYISS